MKNSNPTYILSLDIGTSSVRGIVFDDTGTAVDGLMKQLQYSMQKTDDGGEFTNADDLCDLVYQIIDAIAEQTKEKSMKISAVSCCTFWHNVVGVNAQGKACTPLLNWSDTRPESVLPQLKEILEPKAFTARTGCPMHASFLPAKLTWAAKAMSDEFVQADHWMSFGEYLFFQITGERKCSYSMASGSGLLYSKECVWDQETLTVLPIDERHLSPLCDKHDPYESMKPELAKRWEFLRNAKWFPALGDGACNNIGSGCAGPDKLTLMVGTSGAMRIVWKGEYRQPPEGLWCYRIDRNRPIQGGALSNGGNLFAWMKNTLNLPDEKELEHIITSAKPDSHGLTILPFLSGQRAPRWNPNSRAMIYGLRASTKPEQILHAGLESIAMRFRLIYDLLKPLVADDHILVASGGGLLKSPAWIQIMADVLGRPVRVSQVQESSCRGAALCALESLGVLDGIEHADPCLGETVNPREENIETYSKAVERHVNVELAVRESSVFL